MGELVRQYDVARRVLRQFLSKTGQRGPLDATGLTLGELLDGDVVELLDLLHDELGLVDLDDDGGVARAAAGEAELAERVLDLLGDGDEDGGGALWRGEWVLVHECGRADHGGGLKGRDKISDVNRSPHPGPYRLGILPCERAPRHHE